MKNSDDPVDMYIVQLKDGYEFLCPSVDGDVTSTPLLNSAGVFVSKEAATDTADHYSGAGSYYLIAVSGFEPTYQ